MRLLELYRESGIRDLEMAVRISSRIFWLTNFEIFDNAVMENTMAHGSFKQFPTY